MRFLINEAQGVSSEGLCSKLAALEKVLPEPDDVDNDRRVALVQRLTMVRRRGSVRVKINRLLNIIIILLYLADAFPERKVVVPQQETKDETVRHRFTSV